MPRNALSCISCGRKLDNTFDDVVNQPSGGTAFQSNGHYGSTTYDPMDGRYIEINVCDECLKEKANLGLFNDEPVVLEGREAKRVVAPDAGVVGWTKTPDRPLLPWKPDETPSECEGEDVLNVEPDEVKASLRARVRKDEDLLSEVDWRIDLRHAEDLWPVPERDIEAELRAAGWVYDEDRIHAPWIQPGWTRYETLKRAIQILDGELCPALLYHGPGHQSSTRCHKSGEHDTHECNYLSEAGNVAARWRTGDYTKHLRKRGIEFSPTSYPETIGMTGFFNEPPEEES